MLLHASSQGDAPGSAFSHGFLPLLLNHQPSCSDPLNRQKSRLLLAGFVFCWTSELNRLTEERGSRRGPEGDLPLPNGAASQTFTFRSTGC